MNPNSSDDSKYFFQNNIQRKYDPQPTPTVSFLRNLKSFFCEIPLLLETWNTFFFKISLFILTWNPLFVKLLFLSKTWNPLLVESHLKPKKCFNANNSDV